MCNLQLEMQERVYLLPGNKIVNSDKSLNNRSQIINGNLLLDSSGCGWLKHSTIRMTQLSLRSMTSLIIIDKYGLVLGWAYNLLQQKRKIFLKIKLYHSVHSALYARMHSQRTCCITRHPTQCPNKKNKGGHVCLKDWAQAYDASLHWNKVECLVHVITAY